MKYCIFKNFHKFSVTFLIPIKKKIRVLQATRNEIMFIIIFIYPVSLNIHVFKRIIIFNLLEIKSCVNQKSKVLHLTLEHCH